VFGFNKRKTMKIRIYGDPFLKKKSRFVDKIDNEITALGKSLIDTMFEKDGIGLAAPQTGIDLRMLSIAVPFPKNRNQQQPLSMSPGEIKLLPMMPMVLINPEIISYSQVLESAEEGCLSVPDIYAMVTRPSSILLKARILGGDTFTLECGGFLARAVQHEVDHLDGVLFVDRLDTEEFSNIKNKLDRLLKQHKKR